MRFLGVMTLLLCSAARLAAADADAVRTAVDKSLPLLQKIGPIFWDGSGCISCHNNTLPDIAVAIARDHGFSVNEAAAKVDLKFTTDLMEAQRERLLRGIAPGGGQNTITYVLFGLDIAHVPPNEVTDAGARYLKIRQAADGSWPMQTHRPPLVFSTVTLTALSIRGLKAYAPPAQKASYDNSVQNAVSWLVRSEPRTNEEFAYKLMGLVWGLGAKEAVAHNISSLSSQQRSDGGWAQLPGLDSDAYATGQALVALHEAGMKTTDPIYLRGVDFLVRTQLSDGSWHVKTRSEPSQIYFESGFPHGVDQFISASGSSWATIALALSQHK